MPKYKLMYFDSRGRGETARMLFALKGQEFEDYRFKEGEWPKLKEDKSIFPQGQAPVLLIDGKPLPQSRAINQYLAREFGFYGANNTEKARVDVILDTNNDIAAKMIPIFFGGLSEEEKATKLADFRDNSSKPFLNFLNNAIKEAGGRFFVGNSETLADIDVHVMIGFINNAFQEAYMSETYPDLAKFYKGFSENSKLAAYIKSRP